VRIALAQVDAGEAAARAAIAASDADLVVLPELQLTGYTGSSDTTLAEAVAIAGGRSAVVGFAERDGGSRFNSAVYVEDARPVHVQRKLYLPTYGVWDEGERFTAGDKLEPFDAGGARVATLICNDAWQPFLPPLATERGAEILLMPSASATAMPEVETYWRELTRFYARMLSVFVVFVNRVGREGKFEFWGSSHVVDPLGNVVVEAPPLEPAVVHAEIDVERVRARRRELPLQGAMRPELFA
jgi:predicted amidohydrolase